MSKVNTVLPESLMKSIRVIGKSEDMEPREKFEAVLTISHGFGLWTRHVGQINPTDTVIPSEQWKEICEILMQMKSSISDIGRVNYGLSWTNSGPSGDDRD